MSAPLDPRQLQAAQATLQLANSSTNRLNRMQAAYMAGTLDQFCETDYVDRFGSSSDVDGTAAGPAGGNPAANPASPAGPDG